MCLLDSLMRIRNMKRLGIILILRQQKDWVGPWAHLNFVNSYLVPLFKKNTYMNLPTIFNSNNNADCLALGL